MPAHLRPMLATLASNLPADQHRYSFEYKWDGIRALCYWDGTRLLLESRNQLDMTHRYPELHVLGEALGSRTAILDGEIVALDEGNKPSFTLLQHRMHAEETTNISRLVRQVPICFLVFDLLYLDGQSTMEQPYLTRRDMLEQLMLVGSTWRVPPAYIGEGDSLLKSAREQGLEGVVAKRIDSPYEPGRRSPAWLKIKVIQVQEFVIGGWVPEGGADRSRVGSLLLGYFQPTGPQRGKLKYVGSVGSGFDYRWHRTLAPLLAGLSRPDSPFDERVPKPGALFVRPELVAQVEYRRWPPGGLLHQAAFKGLRTDKRPEDVVPERACSDS